MLDSNGGEMDLDDWQDGAALVTKMLRVWHAARAIGENPLPRMLGRCAPFDPAPEFLSACDSLFGLTEAVLARPLSPARCCSSTLSDDEAALLALLRHAPAAGSLLTSSAVPHRLPEALRWAAFAVVRALGDTFDASHTKALSRPERCPFDRVAIGKAA